MDNSGVFEVYCELDPTTDDGTTEVGWTVFQRRVDNTTDFYRCVNDQSTTRRTSTGMIFKLGLMVAHNTN